MKTRHENWAQMPQAICCSLPLNALSQGYMAPLKSLIIAWCLALSRVLTLVFIMALPI